MRGGFDGDREVRQMTENLIKFGEILCYFELKKNTQIRNFFNGGDCWLGEREREKRST
jgi:hypothetical protein